MYFKMLWNIEIGQFALGMLDSVEITKSVELLADTCAIKLPATIANRAIATTGTQEIEGKIKRGNKVTVKLGYEFMQKQFWNTEFEGYLLNAETDDGSLVLNCEDDLFLMRKAVANKQFKSVQLKEIAQYIVRQTAPALKVNCTYTIVYDKFVIHNATGYDVLKKLQDETKGNIYINKNAKGEHVLNIHPPFIEKHGRVRYSFQQNIESSDLKYKTAADKILQVEVTAQGKDGKTITVTAGKPGGDKINVTSPTTDLKSMQKLADETYNLRLYDGYDGGITTWLIPFVQPGYSAEIVDDEYEFKNGWYYVKSVTTTCSSSGMVRKVDLGIKLGSKQ